MSLSTRWRLVLGRFAAPRLGVALDPESARREAALDFLYSREYSGRGVRDRTAPGSLDPVQIQVPVWLGEVRELFPREVVEVIERHALNRYGMTELVTDPVTLARLEPNFDLLKTLLAFRGHLRGDVLSTARRIIRQVVDDLRRRLEPEIRRALAGRVNSLRHSPRAVAQNFDWRDTVRRNLRHYDLERRRLILQTPRFFSRNDRFLPWEVILCVDQSGSMAASVIHSAVMAGILAGLPLLRVKLVVFSTEVVDLTGQVSDPAELLLSVQLGGGTNIGGAARFCEELVENPRRTVFALISDFCEGGPPGVLLNTCRRMRESGVRLLGLAALDDGAHPAYDRRMAEQLAASGMEIAALTPSHFAGWLARVVHSR